MKKKNIYICLGLILILVLSLGLVYPRHSKKEELKSDTSNLISVYLKNEKNEYEKSEETIWPINGDMFTFNEEQSHCDNNSTIKWVNNKIQVVGSMSDKCYIYFDNIPKNYDYTGTPQEFIVPVTGTYKIELWGASGGRDYFGIYRSTQGLGGYTAGTITLTKGTPLYVYVGEQGADGQIAKANDEGIVVQGQPNKPSFNGGGAGISDSDGNNDAGGSGGGATDIRLVNGSWNNFDSLKSRIIVVGGGGGGPSVSSQYVDKYAGSGGGLTGVGDSWFYKENKFDSSLNATQTLGYKFGIGGNGRTNCAGGSGGGGGYYGGLTDNIHSCAGGGGGGSSFISGHVGCLAIDENSIEDDIKLKAGCNEESKSLDCSIHYSNYKFENTKMIDGLGYKWTTEIGEQTGMPSPSGEIEMGHTGNGYARITYLGK